MKLSTFILACAAACSLPSAAFEYEGLEYEDLGDGTVQLYSAASATGDVTIPATVYDTEGNAYTVVALRKSSFRDAQVDKVTLPETLRSIGSSAFAHSTVKYIKFNEGLENIGNNAFYDCKNLDNVVLPNSLKDLGEMAFIYCESLMKIAIPEGITTLRSATFKECTRLETVELPSTLTTFEDQVFSTCYALESIAVPEGTTEIPESFCYQCTQLTDLQLPETVETIRNGAFALCYGLEHINLPNSLTTLLNGAFSGCYNLQEVVVPSSVRTMGSDVFYQNASVKTITLGENLEVMGFGTLGTWEVLSDNTHRWALTDIFSLNPVPPHFEYDGFARPEPDFFSLEEFTDEEKASFYQSVTLHVPDEAIEAYSTASLWSEFRHIVGDAVGISSPVNAQAAVEAGEGSIHLSNLASGTSVRIYNTAGSMVGSSTAATSGGVHFDALPAGVYMVRAAGKTHKVMVR